MSEAVASTSRPPPHTHTDPCLSSPVHLRLTPANQTLTLPVWFPSNTGEIETPLSFVKRRGGGDLVTWDFVSLTGLCNRVTSGALVTCHLWGFVNVSPMWYKIPAEFIWTRSSLSERERPAIHARELSCWLTGGSSKKAYHKWQACLTDPMHHRASICPHSAAGMSLRTCPKTEALPSLSEYDNVTPTSTHIFNPTPQCYVVTFTNYYNEGHNWERTVYIMYTYVYRHTM